ncbi:sugar transferase [Diaminobutyricibacter sp. McL0618]|uniref:sugar transferase n=1 Tax=Leifsonia sp. McL0618 TaxID=3415677 RepID=UPI003CEA5A92
MTRKRYIAIRSVAERALAVVLLVPVSLVLGLVSFAILLAMGRPVLFKQPRLGMRGEVFNILKFRTMIPDAERIGGGYFPAELQLVPPLGRFLRRSSLDELPQLLNVIRGHMSFIGPRPAVVSQGARYTPVQARRLDVPQGLTGLAQVVYRNDAPWSKRIELDVKYVENVSPKLDLWILARTFARVFRSGGVVEGQTAADVDDLPLVPIERSHGE